MEAHLLCIYHRTDISRGKKRKGLAHVWDAHGQKSTIKGKRRHIKDSAKQMSSRPQPHMLASHEAVINVPGGVEVAPKEQGEQTQDMDKFPSQSSEIDVIDTFSLGQRRSQLPSIRHVGNISTSSARYSLTPTLPTCVASPTRTRQYSASTDYKPYPNDGDVSVFYSSLSPSDIPINTSSLPYATLIHSNSLTTPRPCSARSARTGNEPTTSCTDIPLDNIDTSKTQGYLICKCCPKKPRRFKTADELK